jgi:hypothetical protein
MRNGDASVPNGADVMRNGAELVPNGAAVMQNDSFFSIWNALNL